jgi:hypothetical protein
VNDKSEAKKMGDFVDGEAIDVKLKMKGIAPGMDDGFEVQEIEFECCGKKFSISADMESGSLLVDEKA